MKSFKDFIIVKEEIKHKEKIKNILNILKINCDPEEVSYFSFFDRNFVMTIPSKYVNKNKLIIPLSFVPNHAEDKLGHEYNFNGNNVTISGHF